MIYFPLSIYDMQNEKDYFYQYNEFEYYVVFVKVFSKVFYALLGFEVLTNKVYLFLTAYFKIFISFKYLKS